MGQLCGAGIRYPETHRRRSRQVLTVTTGIDIILAHSHSTRSLKHVEFRKGISVRIKHKVAAGTLLDGT